MNIIWVVLIAVSVLFSLAAGTVGEFTKSMFDAAKAAVEISLFLAGIVSLWLGITKIIEESGLIHALSKVTRPVISRLFKNVPAEHPSITAITLNLLANLFGLGNAATPLGIKAMKDLQTLNPEPDTVSNDMMLFIVINTASIQLIPFTVIGILADYGSSNPSSIVLPTIVATVISTATALAILSGFRRALK